jgi:hypothetical protein
VNPPPCAYLMLPWYLKNRKRSDATRHHAFNLGSSSDPGRSEWFNLNQGRGWSMWNGMGRRWIATR